MKQNYQLLGIILFVYLMSTILIFEFGPWPWPVDNKIILYSYLIMGNMIFILFYYLAINIKEERRNNNNYKLWFKISLILSIILIIPTSYSRIGLYFPGFSGIFNNLGDIYLETRLHRQTSSSVVEYIRILFSPFLFSLFPLTVYYWKELSNPIRSLSIITSIIYILISINMGISKLIVDHVLILATLLIIKIFSVIKFDFNSFKKYTLVGIGLVVISLSAFAYFQSTQEGRGSGEISHHHPRVGMYADTDTFILRNIPEEMEDGVVRLTSYMTQGYYGLSLSMKEPFTWTYGIGNSIFLTSNLEGILNLNIEENTYPYKTIKYGWDPYIQWSSLYSWLASDFTFVGALFVIGLVGFLLGLATKDILDKKNFFAIPVLCKLSIIIYYLPANNQIGQAAESLVAFLLLLALWLVSRKYRITL